MIFFMAPQGGKDPDTRALQILELKFLRSCFTRKGPSRNYPLDIPGDPYDFLLGSQGEWHPRIKTLKYQIGSFSLLASSETSRQETMLWLSLEDPVIFFLGSKGKDTQNKSARNSFSCFLLRLKRAVKKKSLADPWNPMIFVWGPKSTGTSRTRAHKIRWLQFLIFCFAKNGPSGNFSWHIIRGCDVFRFGPQREGPTRIRAPKILER